MDEARLAEPLDLCRVRQVQRIDIDRKGVVLGASEIDPTGLFIHPDQAGYHPLPLRQLQPLAVEMPIGAVKPQMPVTVAFRPPDQAAVLEEAVIVSQVDPALVRRLFAEYLPALAAKRIDRQQIEYGLFTVLALDVQHLAIGRPVDPGEVDVAVRTKVHFDPAGAVWLHHEQRNQRVGRPGNRITLDEGLGSFCTDSGAGDEAHRRVIKALHGNAAVVRRPPVSGEAGHFLLRDEFRLAPVDCLGRFFRGDGGWFGPDLSGPQLPVPHERDIAAFGTKRGIEFVPRTVGQPGHLSVQPGQIEITIKRYENRLAIR